MPTPEHWQDQQRASVQAWLRRGERMTFGQAPGVVQQAAASYLVETRRLWAPSDGEATAAAADGTWAQRLPDLVHGHGSDSLVVTQVRAAELREVLLAHPDIATVCDGTWSDYVEWWQANRGTGRGMPPGAEPWPLIASATHDDVLIDGWHRLVDQIQAGAEYLTLVFLGTAYDPE